MDLEEKRRLYKCGSDYVPLEKLVVWKLLETEEKRRDARKNTSKGNLFGFSSEINEKITLWKGDITRLEIDAIVNAANCSLLGGGGVDGCIHQSAGRELRDECIKLKGCETGDAKITSGHALPAKHVIHTVGPVGKNAALLEKCYKSCLKLVVTRNIKSIAFCCISTGVYGYPNEDAAHVALQVVRTWMEEHHAEIDRIIFCTYLEIDYGIYNDLMSTQYFPHRSVEDDKPKDVSKATFDNSFTGTTNEKEELSKHPENVSTPNKQNKVDNESLPEEPEKNEPTSAEPSKKPPSKENDKNETK